MNNHIIGLYNNLVEFMNQMCQLKANLIIETELLTISIYTYIYNDII